MLGMASEPMRLAAEQSRIENELSTAAFHHYPVFIKSQDSAAKIAESAETCSELVNKAESDLTELRDGSAALVQQGNKWRTERSKASAASAQLSKIVDILEAPATVEACLRNDLTQEALLVVEHVNEMARTHPEIPFLAEIAAATNEELQRLTSTVVVNRLASPGLTLPLALRLTTFLRRVNVPEAFLRDTFLSLRSIDSLLREAESYAASSPYAYIGKVMAVYKVSVTEAVATYRACFVSSGTGGGVSSAASKSQSNPTSPLSMGTATDTDEYCGASSTLSASAVEGLNAWVATKIEWLLTQFNNAIATISTGAELASLADQAAQCGGALAKVGADVGSLLLATLTDRIVSIFSGHCDTTIQSFSLSLSGHSWTAGPSSSSNNNRQQDAEDRGEEGAAGPSSSNNNNKSRGGGGGDGALMPPMVLLKYLPLAYIANGIASACNDMRKCAAASAWPACCDITRSVIETVVDALVRLRDWMMLDGPEGLALQDFMEVAAEECLPFVCRCVDAIFHKDTLIAELPDLIKPLKGSSN